MYENDESKFVIVQYLKMNDERNERTGSGNLFECYERTDVIKSTPQASNINIFYQEYCC